MLERERFLVLNPGGKPPRRKKRAKKSIRRKNPQFNNDLVDQLNFIAVKIGNMELDEDDRALIRQCTRRIRQLIVEKHSLV